MAVIKTNVLLESACAAGPLKQLTMFFTLHQQLCLLHPLENPTEAPGSQEERCGWNQGKPLAGRSHQTVKLGESLKVPLGFCNKYCSDFSKNFFHLSNRNKSQITLCKGWMGKKSTKKATCKKIPCEHVKKGKRTGEWKWWACCRNGRGEGDELGGF